MAVSRLPYLRAVCLESLRLYPPLPFGLPRVVPKNGAMIDGYVIPTGVSLMTARFDDTNISIDHREYGSIRRLPFLQKFQRPLDF